MPEIVNMEETLNQFSSAVVHGLPLRKCTTDKTVFVHPDNPDGKVRFTFCKLENYKPSGIVAFCQTDHYNGIPCFNVGYATDKTFRQKGIATSLFKAAIVDLSEGLKRKGIEDFYIEVGVEKSNIASQKVASSVLKVIPVDSIDPDSGTPTFGYMCKASTLNFSERYV